MSLGFSGDLSHDAPLIVKKPLLDEARFDITAMIDLVFMMNIFFLVTAVAAGLAEIDLPPARRCAPADPETSVIFTILAKSDREAAIYAADGTAGKPLSAFDPEPAIRQAIE